LFSFALHRGYVLKNPVTLAERARVRAEKPAILTVAEAPALIENAEADFIPAFALGLFAGLRPESEVWPLDWSQIDFKDKTVDVNQSKNLAGERFVKMSENLIEWLRPQAFPLLLGFWELGAPSPAMKRFTGSAKTRRAGVRRVRRSVCSIGLLSVRLD